MRKKPKFFFFFLLVIGLLPVTDDAFAQISNSECQDCHGKKDFKKTLPTGETKSLYIDFDLFYRSIHRNELCVYCHLDIKEMPCKGPLLKIDCPRCHYKGNLAGAPDLDIYEQYDHYVQGKKYGSWSTKKKTLAKYPIAKEEVFQPSENKEYPFEIMMPPMWIPRLLTGFRDWHIALGFRYKIGMLKKTGAICILPVHDSVRPPSYSALPKGAPTIVQTQDVVVNVQTSDVQGDNKEKETKFCSLCGKKIKKTAVFCEYCGGQQ